MSYPQLSEQHKQSYLKEMGIDGWDIAHPEKLQAYQGKTIVLPENCRLLLVSEHQPTASEALLFSKVLASMKLTCEQSLHISTSDLSRLGSISSHHTLTWVWFASCSKEDSSLAVFDEVNKLITPKLAQIDGHTQNRRDLWQQICAYT